MGNIYSLSQLYSTSETEFQKKRVGKFPWSEMTLRRMWARGEFPKPVKQLGRNVWGGDVIDRYAELVASGVGLAEAVIRAEAEVVRDRHDAA